MSMERQFIEVTYVIDNCDSNILLKSPSNISRRENSKLLDNNPVTGRDIHYPVGVRGYSDDNVKADILHSKG